MRLRSWHLSPGGESFAYGGEEVDLSIWDTERAFQSSQPTNSSSDTSGKKRKRGTELVPGEIWRAKNVSDSHIILCATHRLISLKLPNDSLSLRQPIHIKSLAYLPGSTPNSAQIVTGTETGDVRRYDSRAARRPVANWTEIGKIGGVGVVQPGAHEQ